jgi:hypothetical protein
MVRFVVLTVLAIGAATAGLEAVTPAAAQSWAIPDRGFRVEWEPVETRRGPGLRGYVHNASGYTAANVRLLIESVDAAGQVAATTVAYLPGTAPPFDRLYFEVPLKAAAASYRVRVGSWEPVGRGGA